MCEDLIKKFNTEHTNEIWIDFYEIFSDVLNPILRKSAKCRNRTKAYRSFHVDTTAVYALNHLIKTKHQGLFWEWVVTGERDSDLRGLPKSVYTGTMIGLFLPSNTVKLVLYVVMGAFTREIFLMALALLPAVPLGFWAGKRLHERLDEHRLYFVLYALLAVTGLKLLVDSVRALLA